MTNRFLFEISKKIIFTFSLLYFLLFSCYSYCQNSTTEKLSNFYPDNIIRLELSGALMNKLKIVHYSEPLLKSSLTIAPIVGISYYRKIYKSFGLGFSFGGLVVPYNQNYSFSVDENHLMEGDYYLNENEYWVVDFTASCVLEKYFHVNDRMNMFAGLGVQYNYIYSWVVTLSGNKLIEGYDESIPFFRSSLMDNGQSEFISYISKLGVSFKFGKSHILQSAILFNFYNKAIGTGYYEFYNMPFESYGTLELRMNYIGLQISYGIGF